LPENCPQGKNASVKKQKRKIIAWPTLILSGNEKRKTGSDPPINGIMSMKTIPTMCR